MTKVHFLVTILVLAGAVIAPAAAGTKPRKGADAVYAGEGAGAAQEPVPPPMIGSDGSVTRSALDPEALVTVGQPAPDFKTSDSQGRFFRLSLLREKAHAVLVFCPSSGDAPACAARLASLQASRGTLAQLGARVFVVSERGGAEPAAARRAAGPAIEWLADPGLRISACYARRVSGEKSTPRPMVVIVDKQGKVVRALDDPRGTQPQTAELLRSIGPTPPHAR